MWQYIYMYCSNPKSEHLHAADRWLFLLFWSSIYGETAQFFLCGCVFEFLQMIQFSCCLWLGCCSFVCFWFSFHVIVMVISTELYLHSSALFSLFKESRLNWYQRKGIACKTLGWFFDDFILKTLWLLYFYGWKNIWSWKKQTSFFFITAESKSEPKDAAAQVLRPLLHPV